MANKQKKQPAANDRHRKSFEQRYGMTQKDFRELKGVEKHTVQVKAYQRFIKNTPVHKNELQAQASKK